MCKELKTVFENEKDGLIFRISSIKVIKSAMAEAVEAAEDSDNGSQLRSVLVDTILNLEELEPGLYR